MGKPLRALIVEDSPQDAALLLRELRRGGYQVFHERVETAETMRDALDRERWDIVLSDYCMPTFSATAALSIVTERRLDVPFIIVSGTVDEETAVEAMRAGAHDFMAKSKLTRLVPAIERELREAAGRAERRAMQEQLLLSDRMASMGTLAAGVAHEINNPLAALIANLDFALTTLDEIASEARRTEGEAEGGRGPEGVGWAGWLNARFEEVTEPLREAQESADRVRLIVRDLKLFSRGDDERHGPSDVRRVLESSLRMAWNEIRHRARLVKEYGQVPLVQGSEARLGQVFLNLVINAAQAMPEGREDLNEIRVVTRLEGDAHVAVEIRDTGTGIPEAHLERIFEPFFTTKRVGVGTGLGLAICQRIITVIGGRIAIESQLGKGTTFRVLLPVATGSEAEKRPSPEAGAARLKGRILVVDDEPSVISALRRLLGLEHEVSGVTSAQEAADRIATGERFDLILCDLVMPRVTGMDLHTQLIASAPEQAARMVFMTGGAFTTSATHFLERVQNPRVEKPFESASLRALVQSLVRAHRWPGG